GSEAGGGVSIAPSPRAQEAVCILIAASFFHQERHYESRSVLSAKITDQLSCPVLYPGARTCDGRSDGLSGAGRRPTGAKQAAGSAVGYAGRDQRSPINTCLLDTGRGGRVSIVY